MRVTCFLILTLLTLDTAVAQQQSTAPGPLYRQLASNHQGNSARPPANHNTTRDNRLAPRAGNAAANQADGTTGATRARDYNSSRSNTTAARLDNNVEDDEDSGSGNRAQDYNSSRSNNSSSRLDSDADDSDGGDQSSSRTRAQDYNSSRSNTTAARLDQKDVEDDDTDDSGDRAQDYNSSRSNTTTAILNNDVDTDTDTDTDSNTGVDAEKIKVTESLGQVPATR